MGNRVNIQFKYGKEKGACSVYQHWNGGIESTHAIFNAVRDFMSELNRDGDLAYFQARYIQCAGNYLGGACSIGIYPPLKKNDDSEGNDNPNIIYDIGEAADPADIENPAYLDKFMADYKAGVIKKYHTMYGECLQYLRSTKSAYESKEPDILAMETEAARLLEKAKEVKERLKERK